LPQDGLPTACVLKPEWIRSVEPTLLGPQIASFPQARWPEVERALLFVLGFVE
jgi:mRNA-degrading endonuclease toxin of MazEF toxin-antitoxin module